MQCPHCGADVLAGNTFCQRCRKRVTPPSAGFTQPSAPGAPVRSEPVARPPAVAATGEASAATSAATPATGEAAPSGPLYPNAPTAFERPGTITGLAVLSFMGAALTGLATVMGIFLLAAGRGDRVEAGVTFVVYGVFTLLYLMNGIGLLGLKPWGRTLQIVVAVIGLCGIPVGTLIGILVLVYMFKPGTRIIFSGRSPAELTPEEAEEVRKVSKGSAWVVILIAAVLALVMVLIIAAIAIPSLMRARIAANENAAVSDLRTIVSGETMYAEANGRFYDQIDCLTKPTGCVPGSASTQPLLDPRFSANTQHGYQFRFYAGPRPDPGTFDPARVSPSSMTSFAVTATPITPNRSGVNSFCTDDSGRICIMDVSIEGELEGGACPVNCRDVAP